MYLPKDIMTDKICITASEKKPFIQISNKTSNNSLGEEAFYKCFIENISAILDKF